MSSGNPLGRIFDPESGAFRVTPEVLRARMSAHVIGAIGGNEWAAYEVAKCLREFGLFNGLKEDARRRLYDAELADAPEFTRALGWSYFKESAWSRLW